MKEQEMLFAHTLGAGGPDLELMLIAAAMAVLGIIFFFQKAVSSVVSIVLIVLGLGAGAIAFAVGGAAPDGATIEILSPTDGDTVAANEPVEITYEIDPGELPPDELGDMHIYVDGELQSMQTADVLELELAPGTYTVGVEAAQPNHASYDPMIIDEIELTAE